MSTRKEENNNQSNSGWLDGLGSYYNSAKDTFWGKAVPQMNKDAGGFYDTSFWDASQWQQFGGKVVLLVTMVNYIMQMVQLLM